MITHSSWKQISSVQGHFGKNPKPVIALKILCKKLNPQNYSYRCGMCILLQQQNCIVAFGMVLFVCSNADVRPKNIEQSLAKQDHKNLCLFFLNTNKQLDLNTSCSFHKHLTILCSLFFQLDLSPIWWSPLGPLYMSTLNRSQSNRISKTLVTRDIQYAFFFKLDLSICALPFPTCV